jgi:ribosomal protein S6--L-glutamate ligase
MREQGVPVVNAAAALVTAEDKVRCSWLLHRAGVPTPPAVAVQSLDEARGALVELGVAVAKPPYGSLGIGVVKVSRWERGAAAALRRILGAHGLAYLQKLVPSRRAREDLRLFVVGDRVAGAVARRAPAGDFRTNARWGGRARALRPDAALERLAVRAARVIGLEYAGVDVMVGRDGPTVLEVNGAPCWRSILEATGRDMAEEIVAHAAALTIERRSHGREGKGIQGRHVGPRGGPQGWAEGARHARARFLRGDRPQGG